MTKQPSLPIKILKAFSKLRVWGIALALLLMMQVSALANLGKTPVGGANYRFVQLKNGQTIEAQVVSGASRSNEVVSRFASDIVTLGYKWDTSKKYVEMNKTLYPASYAVVSQVFQGDAQVKWVINYLSRFGKVNNSTQPLQNSHVMLTSDPTITPDGVGLWQAEVKAIRFITDSQSNILKHEKLRFQFAIKAVNPNRDNHWQLVDPDLAPQMEQFWADGLVVVDFVDMGSYT